MADRQDAQDIVFCDMCNNSPTQMHCKLCKTNLCFGCIANHVTADNLIAHEVVPFQMRDTVFSYPKCRTHQNLKCEIFCNDCDIPICVRCVASKLHAGHEVSEVLHVFKEAKDLIQRHTEHLKSSSIPQQEKAISDVNKKIETLSERFQSMVSDISKLGKEWHREIDCVINKCKQEVEQMEREELESLQTVLAEIEKHKSTINEVIVEEQNLLKSYNIENILKYRHVIAEFKADFLTLEVNLPMFSPKPVQCLGLEMIGKITKSSVHVIRKEENISIKRSTESASVNSSYHVKGTLDTGYTHLYNIISCRREEEIWVSGNDKDIKRFHIQEGLLETVETSTGHEPNGIALTKDGDLIYTDWKEGSINVVKNGLVQKTVFLKDWRLNTCVINLKASGDLFVGMCTRIGRQPSKIVRFSEFTEKQVFQYDGDGNALFSCGVFLFIAENQNGDICASDNKTKTVVVIDREGNLRFRYNGNLPSSKFKTFCPRGVTTDTKCNIYVADRDNDCIHIINENGHFIRYVDECQLYKPYALCFDSKNNLFVAEHNSSKVKMITLLSETRL